MPQPIILRTVEVAIKPTPQELAEAFWDMLPDWQAEFFNHISNISQAAAFSIQMLHASRSELLTGEGAMVMRTIGDFGKKDGTATKKDHYLVKFGDDSYMGQQHKTPQSALEHIKRLRAEAPPYCNREYQIVRCVETEENIGPIRKPVNTMQEYEQERSKK